MAVFGQETFVATQAPELTVPYCQDISQIKKYVSSLAIVTSSLWFNHVNEQRVVWSWQSLRCIKKVCTIWDVWVIISHWGRVAHICVSKLTIIGSDNGLSPGRRQAIIGTNDGILLIGPLETNFSEIFIEIHTFSFKKMHLKMTSGKW